VSNDDLLSARFDAMEIGWKFVNRQLMASLRFFKVFEWMQEREMTNVASYSSYFKYLGLSRNPSRALQVYGAIQDRSMRVHVSVCNSVLGCLVKNGRFDSSFKLYDEMIREGLSPDPFTYSTVQDYAPSLIP
jgi:pentatricopeptide repeat protein